MGTLNIAFTPASGDSPPVAVLAGHLDNKTCARLDTWLGQYVAEHGADTKLDLDFTDVEFVSSRAVTVIVFYVDRFKEGNGAMRVINLRKEVRTVLERLGFGEMDFMV